jgi:hypothetical protein
MQPRGGARGAAPAAPPGAAPAAPPGAAPAAPPGAAPAALVEQPADDGTTLTEQNALTRWRVPISTRWGALVLTLYTDRHTPMGEAAPVDLGGLAAAVGRVVGGLVSRDLKTLRTAGGDVLHSAADVVSHLHVGLHWRPRKPEPMVEQPSSGVPADAGKGVVPTPAGS